MLVTNGNVELLLLPGVPPTEFVTVLLKLPLLGVLPPPDTPTVTVDRDEVGVAAAGGRCGVPEPLGRGVPVQIQVRVDRMGFYKHTCKENWTSGPEGPRYF